MKSTALVTTALLLAIAPTADAAPLYGTTPVAQSVRFSDYSDTTANGFRTYDAFTLGVDASVERVAWIGLWIDLAAPQPAPAPGQDVATWDVALHADNGGVPGTLLSMQSFAVGDVNASYIGTGGFNVGSAYNVNYYSYMVDLDTPVVLSTGTPYWLSVMARGGTQPQQFAWLGGLGGDGSSYQQFLGPNLTLVSASTVNADRAFSLEGTVAVPEPSALLLLGAAACVLRRARARRSVV